MSGALAALAQDPDSLLDGFRDQGGSVTVAATTDLERVGDVGEGDPGVFL